MQNYLNLLQNICTKETQAFARYSAQLPKIPNPLEGFDVRPHVPLGVREQAEEQQKQMIENINKQMEEFRNG